MPVKDTFTQERFDEICRRLAEGESLRAICRTGDEYPAPSTVVDWVNKRPELAEQYARARQEQADAIFDECFDIADDGTNDWVDKKNPDGSTTRVLDHEHVQRSRLRLDTRKWALARMSPKKYGDRQIIAGDKDMPLNSTVVFTMDLKNGSSTIDDDAEQTESSDG